MELALSIALVIGVLLFMLGFFIVIWAGFKHHFVTGIIAIIPAVNFIILPSVWHRAYIGFYLSIIGALITLGAWYGGGEQYIAGQASKFGISVPFSTSTPQSNDSADFLQTNVELSPQENEEEEQVKEQPEPKQKPAAIVEPEPQKAFEPVGDLLLLPQQPLYALVFESLSVDDVPSLKGEYVRIEQKNGKLSEGKVNKLSSNSLFIEHNTDSGIIAFEVKTDNINTLEKLVKRNN